MNKHTRVPGRAYLRRFGARKPGLVARTVLAVTLAAVVTFR